MHNNSIQISDLRLDDNDRTKEQQQKGSNVGNHLASVSLASTLADEFHVDLQLL